MAPYEVLKHLVFRKKCAVTSKWGDRVEGELCRPNARLSQDFDRLSLILARCRFLEDHVGGQITNCLVSSAYTRSMVYKKHLIRNN